ncbi:MAG: cell division protein ZapA [Oscillospiraceae bacterium]|nr:cell division protein ZapA [Oscillospiraceae bacterium]
MEKNRIQITICGVEYVLVSENEEPYVASLAAELENKMRALLQEQGRMSATQAAVLCALNAMDEARQALVTAEGLRAGIQDYLEDAARLKKEAELSRHEAERLHKELMDLKRKR